MTASHIGDYAELIRKSFASVAEEFGLTKENCPGHTSFITNKQLALKVKDNYFPFGYFIGDKMVGFASLTDRGFGTFEISNLAVLPEYRHYGYGKAILEFCKEKVREMNGKTITIGIIEHSTTLKNWYIANGFVHTETHKFDHLPFIVGFMEWSV